MRSLITFRGSISCGGKRERSGFIFPHTVKNDLSEFIVSIDYGAGDAAAELIIEVQKNGNRVHVSGIGKPGYIAG